MTFLLTLGIPAILLIAIAAFLDTQVFSGYIFYGLALLAAATVLYANGNITWLELLIGAYVGTSIASLSNFYLGRSLHNTSLIQAQLKKPTTAKIALFLKQRGLLTTMMTCRFITLLRPAYSLTLGAIGTKQSRFIRYEILVAFIWTAFWTSVLILGEEIISQIVESVFN